VLVVVTSIVLMIIDWVAAKDQVEVTGSFSLNTVRLVRVFKIVRIFGRLKVLHFATTATSPYPNESRNVRNESREISYPMDCSISGQRWQKLNTIPMAMGATIVPVLHACVLVGKFSVTCARTHF